MAESSFIFPGSLEIGGTIVVNEIITDEIAFGSDPADSVITQLSPGILVAGKNSDLTATAEFRAYNFRFEHLLYNAYAAVIAVDSDPVITSGFGTNPVVLNTSSTAAFVLQIGTGGTDSTGVLTMPGSVANDWILVVVSLNGVANHQTKMSAKTGDAITLTNYNLATGAPIAWAAGELLQIIAMGRNT